MNQPSGVSVTWSPAELCGAGLISEVPALTLTGHVPLLPDPAVSPLAAMPGGWQCSLSGGLISVCRDSLEALTRMPVGWRKQRAGCKG